MIGPFVSLYFAFCAMQKKTLAEVSELLFAFSKSSRKSIFIDETKIESAANMYTFVWKKAVTKIKHGSLKGFPSLWTNVKCFVG